MAETIGQGDMVAKMEIVFDEESLERQAGVAEDRINRKTAGNPKGTRNDNEEKSNPNSSTNRIIGAVAMLGQRITSSAFSISGNPAAALSSIASISGGIGAGWGNIAKVSASAVGAIAGLEVAAIAAAHALSPFNAQLFSAATQFDYAMMGIKFNLANQIAPTLSRLMAAGVPLISALADLSGQIVNTFGPALEYALGLLAGAIIAASNAVHSLQRSDGKESHAFNMALGGAGAGAAVGSIFPVVGTGIGAGAGFLSGLTVGLIRDIHEEVTGIADNTDSINKLITDLAGQGQQVAGALFNSMQAWGHGAGFGAQPGGGARGVPNVALAHRDAQGLDPAEGFIRAHMLRLAAMAKGGQQDQAMHEVGKVFPRPSPAAVNFKVSDTITVEASDYDRIHAELIGMVDRMIVDMHQMQDSRWMRLARARFTTLPAAMGRI